VGDRTPHDRLHRDPRSSHQQLARLTRRLGASPALDVGAAQGLLARLVAGSGLILDAVEPHPAWAACARPFYRAVHVGTVAAAALPPPNLPHGRLWRCVGAYRTRDTAAAMLRAAGLRVAHAYPTGIPLDELWPAGEGRVPYRLMQRAQHRALRLAPRLFAFQWVFVAYPVPPAA